MGTDKGRIKAMSSKEAQEYHEAYQIGAGDPEINNTK